ncbi:MAG: DUF3316 domain-containing protein [Muribaculaceae bacterium]|nr:DUF3316 domain-containing protein [Muribaculaceae bacterium]
MIRRFVVLFIAVVATIVPMFADDPEIMRPVYSAYMFEAGSSHLAETYLSPLHYDGWTIALAHRRAQAMRFNPLHWHMELGGRVSLDRTLARPARNVVEWRAELELDWSMMHKWRLEKGLKLYAGGFTRADAGVFYLARNGNNPVAAKASWTIGPKVGASYDGRLGRVPVALRYFAEMPLTGIFFSPAYGELYYEIYLGNRRGLVRGAWPGNYFRLDNTLTADFRFGATILRVGYAPRVFSSKTSDIVTRTVSHSFIFGVAQEWTAIGGTKPDTRVQNIISAY